MKNNNSPLAWLFTPFKFVAGTKALIVGIFVMIALSVLGYFSHSHFNGAIGMQYAPLTDTTPYIVHLLYQVSAWLSLTFVFYITARIVSKSSVRLIDIAGTMALSQIPLLIFALFGFIPAIHLNFGGMESFNLVDALTMLKENLPIVIFTVTIGLIPIIWSILLKYNAYTVSANTKGIVGGVSFSIALIVSEILSKVINYIIISLF